jgi:hypothetical protein
MSFLAQVKSGKLVEPVTLLLYGVDGVGKSTFGSEAPRPIFLGAERGTSQLDVSRFPEPKSFKECREMVDELTKGEGCPFSTLVVDTLDWLEPLIWKEVLDEQVKKVSDVSKIGYNKGYESATLKAREFMALLTQLKDTKKMNIILLAHSKIKTFQDPITPQGYDRYMLALRDDMANVWRQYVDAVMFANYEVFVKDDEKRGYGDGLRVLYTEERPSFQAKNRYGLPFRLPLRKGEGWKVFIEAVEKGEPNSLDVLSRSIATLKATLTDVELLKKVDAALAEAGTNPQKLTIIRDRLLAIKGELA